MPEYERTICNIFNWLGSYRTQPAFAEDYVLIGNRTGKFMHCPFFLYSPMSRELALLMICPVASLMKSTAMFSTSVPLKILYIPPYM